MYLQGRGDMSDAVIREMQETTMSERRSTTETNQQKGRTKNIHLDIINSLLIKQLFKSLQKRFNK